MAAVELLLVALLSRPLIPIWASSDLSLRPSLSPAWVVVSAPEQGETGRQHLRQVAERSLPEV